MRLVDMDGKVNGEIRAMLKEVKKFASNMARPAGIELDALPGPEDVFAPGSPLWEVFRAYRKLDLHLPGISEELGGMGEVDPEASLLLAERLGHADAGLALGLAASDAPFQIASMAPTKELNKLVKEYCEDYDCTMIGCVPVDTGPGKVLCDNGGKADNQNTLTAVSGKSGYVVSGEIKKAMNANMATHALCDVVVRTKTQPDQPALAVVPLDLPGVTRKGPWARTGQRSLNQGGLAFREVNLPRGYVIRMDQAAFNKVKHLAFLGELQYISSVFAGVALGAVEEALKYSRGRIQGGVPIFEHANIRMQLFNMLKVVEATRANNRRLAGHFATANGNPSTLHAVMAKSLATETASRVASEAIQIFGGYGLTKEFPIEKMFRDSRVAMIEHGANEDLALAAIPAN
ncbi:MAG: acyl-CoA dehydrogenase family protein [Desulfatibacillaceae bacterium]